jgi:hypothetical protein
MWTVTRFLISDQFAFTVFLRYAAALDLSPDRSRVGGWPGPAPRSRCSLRVADN